VELFGFFWFGICGVGLWGLVCGVLGFGPGVWFLVFWEWLYLISSGSRVRDTWVWGLGCLRLALALEVLVQGSGFRVQGLRSGGS